MLSRVPVEREESTMQGRTLLVAALLLGSGSLARAQDPDGTAPVASDSLSFPLVGTYDASGTLHGKTVKGTVVVRRDGNALVFDGKLGSETLEARDASPANGATSYDFVPAPPPSDTVGIDGKIVGERADSAAGKNDLSVKGTNGSFTATLTEKGAALGKLTLTREKEVLIMWGTYMNAMKVYAEQVGAYYKSKGYKVTEHAGDSWLWSPTSIRTALTGYEAAGHSFERIVLVSHGGWDGPMIPGADGENCQYSPGMDAEGFTAIAAAFKRASTPDAIIILSACHEGGSNAFEAKESYNDTQKYTDSSPRRPAAP
jgi:hypothetical protein